MQYGINHDKNKNERRFIIYKCFRAQEIQLDFNPFSFYKTIFKTQSLFKKQRRKYLPEINIYL